MRAAFSAGLSAALLGLAASCSTLNVKSDYDPRVDYGKYRTYDWLPQAEPSAEAKALEKAQASAYPLFENPLVRQRIKKAIERELAAKSIRPLQGAAPDLYVAFRTGAREKLASDPSAAGVGYGYGPFLGYVGPGWNVYEYTVGTLVIDLVDASKKQLVWRGYASDVIDNDEMPEEEINKIVQKIMENYPPQPEKR